jgi:tRNA A-37 threonylcarbamoyl transferase component Bud32
VYFVNWQREVSVEERNGQKVVIKRNKRTKELHELLLIYLYSLISMLMAHPSSPPVFRDIMRNEGYDMRKNLKSIGVSTPALISISNSDLVEEYIDGGDLYRVLASGSANAEHLAGATGHLTARMHKAGYVFTDNKAQNYLVKGDSIFRTDLGFIKKSSTLYSRSMDIGTFLASVIDLDGYGLVEKAFYNAYTLELGNKFPYLSIVLRNILSAGFSSNGKRTIKNMLLDSRVLVDA